MARDYRIQMGAFDIGEWEFKEVEALARRYRAMKRRADVLERCNAAGVHGEKYAAMRWECSLVETALKETADGKWEKALAKACCDGMAYVDIDPADMPTSNRNEFFVARREFYWRLWGLRQRQLGAAIKANQHVKGS